jgi:hypothetical protein
VNRVIGIALTLLLLVGAHALGAHANQTRTTWPKSIDLPFAPSPATAPYVSLGYREAAADLLWIRAIGYVGGDEDRAAGTRSLVEAIVALDPRFERVYEFAGIALTAIDSDATVDDKLAAIRVLERGMREFPKNCKLALVAGQIYTVDLQSDDPEQVKQWELEGARYLERAVRLPGCPKNTATVVAYLRTKLGQREKAIRDLRELVMYTDDASQRQKLVDKLAELEERDAAALDYELAVETKRFEDSWQANRPEVTPTMFILLGAPLATSFRLEDLAVDRDLVGTEEPIEPLPPLPD